MENSKQISVILCTYNRAQSLGRTLQSIVTQAMPQSIEWEILVVDNNSSDQTRQVVEDFYRRYPERIRYLFEPKQGISNARNAGVGGAQGHIVAFIDDDETADVNWLQNLTANLFDDEWAGAGGRVLPQWRSLRPRWLLSEHSFLAGPLAMFGSDTNEVALTEPPFGANMAFKKAMFDRFGGFRTDLGRIGKGMLSGEDTEFGGRILSAGLRLRYEPNALTHHPVEENRLRRSYFLSWWFNKGRTDILEREVQPKGKRLLGIPIRLLRDAAVEAVRWGITPDPSLRFVCVLKIWAYAGQAYESYLRNLSATRNSPARISVP